MKYAAGIFFCIAAGIAAAQDPGRDMPDALRQLIESVAANADEEKEVDLQALYDTYETLLEFPLDLNAATETDLQQLQILNDFQIQSLLEYRKEYGELYTVHELPLIHGFNEEIAAQLYPFITALPVPEWQRYPFADRFTHGRHQLVIRAGRTLEEQKGYAPMTPEDREKPNARYLGSPWAFYTRYRYRYRDKAQWGITAKNDAGEPFFNGNNKYGFDFYSAHIQLADIGIIKKIILGDYQIQFGQGLVAWGGYALSKAGDVLSIKKQERGLTAYTSTNESLFRRGIALTLQHKQWNLSLFISHKNIDATTDSNAFSTILETGLHNTAGAMKKKHTLPETVAGSNLSFRFKRLKIGLTALWHRYGKNFQRDPKPYNYFELNEAQNANASLDFYSVWEKTSLFGEFALSRNGGIAALAGALFDLDAAFRLSLLYRNYARNYQAIYARGFGETGKTANENGCYIGAQWLPHPDITLSAYADLFSFPWMRYRVSAPSKGYEYYLQAAYAPDSAMNMYLRIKQEIKDENNNAGADDALLPQHTVNLLHARYEISYRLCRGLRMQNRIEISFYRADGREHGLLLYHNINYKLPAFPVDISMRFAVFDTGGWNTRFYAYENDLLYTFSLPAYYDKGARWYLNAHLKLRGNFDLWVRLAQTYFFHADTAGNGLNETTHPFQTTLKLQASVKF
ncbi:MAG: helix-hairpin-helix domain-containing protein [Prevotellaceae bacterium]|jgi:hypothetical protein|nr:helix-hairpin-helix domain-containing protein [Prevotellaceae bacterium]